MALTAHLGDLTFRINPSQVAWDYRLDTSVTPTIGGRVVQVYGATLGDMTIQGLFGNETTGKKRNSGVMAEEFQAQIAQMVVAQSKAPTTAQLIGTDPTPMHKPFRFVCSGDNLHNWDFQVYIKSLTDVNDPSVAIEHKVGKFSYGYNLVLFIVEDNTGQLKKVATDEFINRLAQGVGWQRTSYNGTMKREDLEAYLAANSPDGTIHGLVLKQFQEVSQGNMPKTGFLVPNPTAQAAQGQGVGTQAPPPVAAPPLPPAPAAGLPAANNGAVTIPGGAGGGPAIVIPTGGR
jgi:hypothetical protein